MVRTVMGRHELSDNEEQEAEILASLILERTHAAQSPGHTSAHGR